MTLPRKLGILTPVLVDRLLMRRPVQAVLFLTALIAFWLLAGSTAYAAG